MPLHSATAIATATFSLLSALKWTLDSPAQTTMIALFSDGDKEARLEDDDVFKDKMTAFQSAYAFEYGGRCLSLFSVHLIPCSDVSHNNHQRLVAFTSYSTCAKCTTCQRETHGDSDGYTDDRAGTATTFDHADAVFACNVACNDKCMYAPESPDECFCPLRETSCRADHRLLAHPGGAAVLHTAHHDSVELLEECCDEVCYEQSTPTTTPTTTTTVTTTPTSTSTTTPTSTATTTPTTTTPTTTALPTCACDECFQCDCNFDWEVCHVANSGFDICKTGMVEPGPLACNEFHRTANWDFETGAAMSVQKSDSGYELFVTRGEVTQRTTLVPESGHTYVLEATVAVQKPISFAKSTLALRVSGEIVASKTLEADSLVWSESEPRDYRSVSILFEPYKDYSEPLEVVLKVEDSVKGRETYAGRFDDVCIYEKTDKCQPLYPACEQAAFDLVLMVDVSGSITSIKQSTDNAVEMVNTLFAKLIESKAGATDDDERSKHLVDSMTITVFCFAWGDAQLVLARYPISRKGDIVSHLHALVHSAPLNAGTSIGQAHVSLTNHPEFIRLWRQGSDATSVVLFSDGDANVYESAENFHTKLDDFQRIVNLACTDSERMCDSGTTCVPEYQWCEKARGVHGHDDESRVYQCPDKSDEAPWNCYDGIDKPTTPALGPDPSAGTAGTPATPATTTTPTSDPCADRFTCTSGTVSCVPVNWVCDKMLDCADGSDESAAACGGGAAPLPPDPFDEAHSKWVDLCASLGDAVFHCVAEGSVPPCVSSSSRCDGIDQCADGSDEADCAAPTPAGGADTGGVRDDTATCTGKSLSSGGSCWCRGDCFACTYEGGEATTCSRCKNGAALLEGVCVSQAVCVSSGGKVVGTGKFDLTCAPLFSVTAEELGAAPAQPVKPASTCEGKKDDHGGKCWCSAELQNCHTCALDADSGKPAACSVCKNERYLYEGKCISKAECKAKSGKALGRGKFGRECSMVSAAAALTCTGRKDDLGGACWCNKGLKTCHSCALNDEGAPSTCLVCKSSAVLLDGKCVPAAACDGKVVGQGKFGRVCQQ